MTGKINYDELARFCADCAEEKLAENVEILPIGAVSSIADYFVIATANSDPQLRAVAGFVERRVREEYRLHTVSGSESGEGGWLLLDFGNVIVHIMTPEMRSRYNLEGLWGNTAKRRAMRTEA